MAITNKIVFLKSRYAGSTSIGLGSGKAIFNPAYLDFKKTILLVITMIFYGATILKVGFFL